MVEQLWNGYLLLNIWNPRGAVEDDVLQDGEGSAESPGINSSLAGYIRGNLSVKHEDVMNGKKR